MWDASISSVRMSCPYRIIGIGCFMLHFGQCLVRPKAVVMPAAVRRFIVDQQHILLQTVHLSFHCCINILLAHMPDDFFIVLFKGECNPVRVLLVQPVAIFVKGVAGGCIDLGGGCIAISANDQMVVYYLSPHISRYRTEKGLIRSDYISIFVLRDSGMQVHQ